MKKLIVIFTYAIAMNCCSTSLFSQQVIFKNQSVDTFIVRSMYTAYQFDEKGTTKGESDVIIYAFDSLHQQYKIYKYYKDNFEATNKPEKLQVKTKKIELKKEYIIDVVKMNLLLSTLTMQVNFNQLYSQLDTQKIKNLLTEKQVRTVAKWYKIDRLFKPKYSSSEQNKKLFNEILSMDSLKVYLMKRFDTTGYIMVTDYSNTFNLYISTKTNRYVYEGKYPNPVMQPWYHHKSKNITESEMIVNLNINKYLHDFLPENFLLKETISDEALVYDYIKWCFQRRSLIY